MVTADAWVMSPACSVLVRMRRPWVHLRICPHGEPKFTSVQVKSCCFGLAC